MQYCLFLGFQAFTIFFFYHSQLNFSLSSSSSSSLSISLLYYLVLGMIIIPRYLQVWLKMYLCNQTVTQCLVVTPLLDAQISNTGSYNFVISPCKQSPPRLNKHELSCSIVFLSFFFVTLLPFFFFFVDCNRILAKAGGRVYVKANVVYFPNLMSRYCGFQYSQILKFAHSAFPLGHGGSYGGTTCCCTCATY